MNTLVAQFVALLYQARAYFKDNHKAYQLIKPYITIMRIYIATSALRPSDPSKLLSFKCL